MKVDVLGTDYEVMWDDMNNPALNDADGICKGYEKQIILRKKEFMFFPSDGTDEAKTERLRDVVTHELIHAFCMESGVAYDNDEQLVDFFAKMIRHIEAARVVITQRMKEEGAA